MIPKYDRLTGMDSKEEDFQFICPHCNKDGIKVKDLFTLDIIGVSYKPSDVDNTSLQKEVRLIYDALPTERQAILNYNQDSHTERLIITCKDCAYIDIENKKINKVKLRKWCNIHLPDVLDLRALRKGDCR